ncbi:hypothetical protein O181_012004, partial [Austropuccinia psidii MF-1]|nr:hypothetical protein [Austropuccinia psidii MF-1]
AKVCAKIHQEGIPVWLRAFHEVNWYQRTGEYSGGPKEFKEAWDVLAKAVRQFAPGVWMHWSPNIAHNNNTSEYHEYQPYRFEETVDLVGIDYYPSSKPAPNHFVDSFKYFHDTFASERRKMVIAETGLHYYASLQDKLDWLDQIAKGKSALPHLVGVVWYNQKKGWDDKIAGKGISNLLEAQL